MSTALASNTDALSGLLITLDANHNTSVIINPKFYFLVCVQNVLYLRVIELFKDQLTMEISVIPLNFELYRLESDIPITCRIMST